MSVSENIYEVLRERLLSGQLFPGVRLVEADLTAEFQASRATIREVLRRLVADELVELLPNRGIRVRQLSPRDLEELYVVRIPIEGLAARLAAEADSADLDELRECYAEGERAIADGDALRYMRANARLHSALVVASGNATLQRIATRLNTQVISFQAVVNQNLRAMRESHAGHFEVLQAVEAHDGDAAEAAMRRHIAGGRRLFGPTEQDSEGENSAPVHAGSSASKDSISDRR